MRIINICFTDDILLFTRGDVESIKIITIGLYIGGKKSKVYFGGMEEVTKQGIQTATSFERGNIPFKYLGVPLDCKKVTVLNCMLLIDRMLCRINHWSSNLLSYAGRFLLVKSLLFSIANYWM